MSRQIHPLLLGLFVITALSGCRGERALTVKKVIVDVEPAAEAHTEREVVRDDVRRLLGASERFVLKEGSSDGATVRVRVFVVSAGQRGVRGAGVDPSAAPHGNPARGGLDEQLAKLPPSAHPAMVSLTVTAFGRDKDKKRYQYRGAGVAQQEVAQTAIDLDALLLQALATAVKELEMGRAAEHLESPALIARLTDPAASSALKRQAIKSLGARKAKDAVPGLSAVLLGDDKELANAALSALTDIGDPRAVDAIITYANGKPTLVRKRAINAIRVMGTRKGQAWLFTLSTGHPDPDVQTAAQNALAAVDALDTKVEAKAPDG